MTSTPFPTRLVTSPSITASCMITPIRRVLFRLHSRNSAPSMSSSTYRFMLGRLSPAPDIRIGHRQSQEMRFLSRRQESLVDREERAAVMVSRSGRELSSPYGDPHSVTADRDIRPVPEVLCLPYPGTPLSPGDTPPCPRTTSRVGLRTT